MTVDYALALLFVYCTFISSFFLSHHAEKTTLKFEKKKVFIFFTTMVDILCYLQSNRLSFFKFLMPKCVLIECNKLLFRLFLIVRPILVI